MVNFGNDAWVQAFFDATFLPWAYDFWPPDTVYPEVMEAFQTIMVVGEATLNEVLPQYVIDHLEERAAPPEVMYR